MLAPVNLGGAKQRLLPERIPALFFGTAVLAQIAAWLALVLVADAWSSYAGGPGPVLAAVHILTLGVLLCTAIGASLQMLPVILARPAPGERICLCLFSALAAGASALVFGFATSDTAAIALGATLLLVVVLLYGWELGRLLAAAGTSAPTLRQHVGAALLSLTGGIALALALVGNYSFAFLPDHGRVAVAHATLVAFGFMGMLALGLSQVLIPMFAVAEPASDTALALTFRLAAFALALAVTGELRGLPVVTAAAALLALAAAAAHIRAMMRTVAGRMRRRLGPEFILIYVSWGALLLGLVIAGLLSLGLPPASGALLIAVVLYGWLLSLLTGVLQRVLPFLASMQVARLKARPLAPGKLVTDLPLKMHLCGHLVGLAALVAGTLLAAPLLIVFAGSIGAIGAGAFAWFAAIVLLRTRTHLKTYPAGWKETIA